LRIGVGSHCRCAIRKTGIVPFQRHLSVSAAEPVTRSHLRPGRLWSGLGAVLALATLWGCQSYRPAPPNLAAFPAALAERNLAEKSPEETWSGADLISVALRQNPRIAEMAARYRTALAAAHAASVGPSASLTLSVDYTNEASSWLYGAAADIPLDQGARRRARLTAADLAVLQAEYDYQDAVWSVRTAITRARSDWQASEQELALATELVAVRQARSHRIESRVAAGEDARPLALAAQAELATAKRQLTLVSRRRDQARLALAQALGVGASQVAGLNLAAPALLPPPAATRTARQNAILGRADVLRALVDYDLAENALRTEVARQYPEVRIGPGYSYDHGVRKLPFNLTLILPPADLNRAAIAQAEARRVDAGKALEAVQATVIADMDRADRALSSALSELEGLTVNDLPLARAGAAVSLRSLAAGESDRVDEQASRAARLEVEIARVQAQQAAEAAAVDLEDALRAPFDPAERDLLQAAVQSLRDGT